MVFRIYNSSSCQQPIPMYSQFWELMMISNEEFLYNIQFGFPVFDSNTGSFLWFCLSLHVQFGLMPWIVCLSLHIWKCWDMPSQCRPICTRTPSQPRRPLPLVLMAPTAWSGERPFFHRKNLREETSLWDNLLRRYLCPVSRLCRPTSFGLAIITPSRGVESPVPTCVHTLDCGWWVLWEPPGKKKIW